MKKLTKSSIRVVQWSPQKSSAVVESFLKRPPIDAKAEAVARKVLEDIGKRGDAAVAEYAAKFDGSRLKPSGFAVTEKEFEAADREVSPVFKKAAADAHRRVERFARAGIRKNWQIPTPKGGRLGEQFVPYDIIGTYIPGGEAPLASTALMTITLAKVAGVPEIVACTPADKDGRVDPHLLHAVKLAGATKVFKVGGIQAVGAMACGTKTIPRVQKIAGPGGPYVTAAKRLVYGIVSLDMVAGPSEIAVLADTSIPPAYIAADLLSQAEHGTGHEKALLVTDSMKTAEAVREELVKQARTLTRREAIAKVLTKGTLLVVTANLEDGMELCNRFAPEHFELQVKNPEKWVARVRAAGAVFLGKWTPEPAGDFVAGPSHVLPTGGTAALFSGLTVDDFQRRTSVISLTKADLEDMLPSITAFADVETLPAHRRSATIRFEDA
ncbi:MAG: histidinol dehydrogenase [Verrucomicrobia bacterium]|nr:histidinol dehydrogenase [Verrucomicrobiota bacterium]